MDTEDEKTKRRARLLDQAKGLTSSPGVYLMKDERGVILYIGKAKVLRSRVSSYFQAQPHDQLRTELMVTAVRTFEVILTETEAEALLLECTLIKKHKPRFNVRMKDDKSYPYIRIRVSEDWPRLEWTRQFKKDGAHYHGPFTSAWAAKQVLKLLNESFGLRDCSDNTFKHRSRPCILYQMERCSAPCVGFVDRTEYQERIQKAEAVLEGRDSTLQSALQKKMDSAVHREDFEYAAHLRDQLRSLEVVTQTQGVVDPSTTVSSRDVIGLAHSEADIHVTVMSVRDGHTSGVKHYHLQNWDRQIPLSQVLFDFLAQYGLEHQRAGTLPNEFLVDEAPVEVELLEKVLSIRIRLAASEDEQRLISVATQNAKYALDQARKSSVSHGSEAIEEVYKKLRLSRHPLRIECFDISNIQGSDCVASRVVFINGAPDKNLYRRYKIRTVDGQNDFAMMHEVLGRRFSNSTEELPDLVVVDGGKGQLAQAVAIFEELGIQGVDVVGLAKARAQGDFQDSEVKHTQERIFKPGQMNPIGLKPGSGAFRLLTHIRDEAHRFAVSYHRLVRKKRHLEGADSD